MKKYNISKKLLIKEYSKNRKTLRQIAKEVGCSVKTIWRYLKKYKVKIRTNSEANRNSNIGNKNGYIDGRYLVQHYCKEPNCNNKISYVAWKYYNSRCQSCAGKKKWKNPEFKERQLKASLKGRKLKPNKPETLLKKILNKSLSKEYKYVGNGEIILGGFNPDFINCNGQKKIIELYGDYWHNRKEVKIRDKRRIKTYAKYGYKALIIWQHELKKIDKIKNRILEFNKKEKYGGI